MGDRQIIKGLAQVPGCVGIVDAAQKDVVIADGNGQAIVGGGFCFARLASRAASASISGSVRARRVAQSSGMRGRNTERRFAHGQMGWRDEPKAGAHRVLRREGKQAGDQCGNGIGR